MRFYLERIESALDANERVKIRRNFDKIEKNFNNVVDVVSERAYSEVVDAARLNWLEPVDKLAELAMVYPDAVEGNAAMVRDTGVVYRYNSHGEWKAAQEISVGPLNEMNNRLTTQLAQIAINANSFPRQIPENNDTPRLQRAIDYLEALGGGTLLIPFGETFYIGLDRNHTGIKVSSNNITIGGGGTLKLIDNQLVGALNYSSYMILVDTKTSNENDTIRNFVLRDITIDQNNQNNVCSYIGYSEDAVTVRHGIDCVIENVSFENIVDSAIMFTSNKRSKIIKNNFETSYRNITVTVNAGSNTVTSANANFTSSDVGSYIAIKGVSTDSSTLFGAWIKNVVDANTIVIQPTNNSILASKKNVEAIINKSDSAIYVSDFWLTSSDSPVAFSPESNRGDRTQDLVITGNTIRGFLTGIHCNRGTSRMIITDNTVRDAVVGLDLSFETSGFTSIPQKNTIANNIFENCMRVGLGLNSAHFLNVSGNKLLNVTQGIELAGCSYCSITGNVLIGEMSPSSYHCGIYVTRGFKDGIETFSDYNSITDNIVSHFWFGISDKAETKGNIYGNNQVKWNRAENNVSNGYTLNSNNYCLDGVWIRNGQSTLDFPQTVGVVFMEDGELKVITPLGNMNIETSWGGNNLPNSTTINASRNTFITMDNYTLPTSITGITGGMVGKEITVHFTNSNITLINSNTFRLSGGVNYDVPTRTIMKFVRINNTMWAEVSRTTN